MNNRVETGSENRGAVKYWSLGPQRDRPSAQDEAPSIL